MIVPQKYLALILYHSHRMSNLSFSHRTAKNVFVELILMGVFLHLFSRTLFILTRFCYRTFLRNLKNTATSKLVNLVPNRFFIIFWVSNLCRYKRSLNNTHFNAKIPLKVDKFLSSLYHIDQQWIKSEVTWLVGFVELKECKINGNYPSPLRVSIPSLSTSLMECAVESFVNVHAKIFNEIRWIEPMTIHF